MLSLNLAGAYFAFTVFQKWRHHVDSKPFNALFINGLSNLVDIGSFQPRSTSHAVLARDQETTTTHVDGEELEAAQIEHKASEHHEAIDAFRSCGMN